MNKYTGFIAASKDGYIADENGSIEFLNKLNIKGDGGYSNYYKDIDVLVYGSKTYQTILDFKLKEWPYKGKTSYVLTSTPKKFKDQKEVIFFKDGIEKLDKVINNKSVWVMGGGNVISQYIKLNMLQKIIISYTKENLNYGIKLLGDPTMLEEFINIKEEDFIDIIQITYIRK